MLAQNVFMDANSFKSIRNSVIATILAGVIISVFPVLRSYFFSFITWLWSGLVWVWEVLVTSYSLPGWGWLVILIFALVGLVNIFLAIKGEAEESEFKSYVEDVIHGAKWRWIWNDNLIQDLWCYCPSCDATLVFDDSSCRYRSREHITEFICENCQQTVISSIPGGNKSYAISAIKREINRRIRTEEYKRDSRNCL